MEEWRDIVGYEGLYSVSNLGRVKSHARMAAHWRGGLQRIHERILKQPRSKGYPVVHLSKDGVKLCEAVHRLVGRAFLGLSPGQQINHLSGVKSDNRVENLEVCTSAENIRHACATGLRHDKGEANKNATLTVADVHAIRARLSRGERVSAIARDYPVNHACIQKIKDRRTWRHVA